MEPRHGPSPIRWPASACDYQGARGDDTGPLEPLFAGFAGQDKNRFSLPPALPFLGSTRNMQTASPRTGIVRPLFTWTAVGNEAHPHGKPELITTREI